VLCIDHLDFIKAKKIEITNPLKMVIDINSAREEQIKKAVIAALIEKNSWVFNQKIITIIKNSFANILDSFIGYINEELQGKFNGQNRAISSNGELASFRTIDCTSDYDNFMNFRNRVMSGPFSSLTFDRPWKCVSFFSSLTEAIFEELQNGREIADFCSVRGTNYISC
jgi:hypothetical protein